MPQFHHFWRSSNCTTCCAILTAHYICHFCFSYFSNYVHYLNHDSNEFETFLLLCFPFWELWYNKQLSYIIFNCFSVCEINSGLVMFILFYFSVLAYFIIILFVRYSCHWKLYNVDFFNVCMYGLIVSFLIVTRNCK